MPPMRPLATKDRTVLIGAAASVGFMSVAIASAIALINISTPTSSDVAVAIALPSTPAQTLDTAASAAPPPLKQGTEALQVQNSAAAEPSAGIPVEPGPLPLVVRAASPAVAKPAAKPLPLRPVPMPLMARRPMKQEGTAEHVAAVPVRPRASPQPAPDAPRIAQRRESPAGMITPSSLHVLSASLHLTSEQRMLYQPLERALLAIAAQQSALARAGQDPSDAFNFGTVMSMYGVAEPFLNALREDQKARVRAEARSMGFGFAAAQI